MNTQLIKLLVLLSFCLSSLSINAQTNQKFGDRFIIGQSFGYINQVNEFYKGVIFHELHWDKKAMISLNKSFYAGIRWLSIFTKGDSYNYSEEKNSYYVVGAFSEFDVIPKFQHRAFVRLAYNYGNYCVCGPENPYKEDGLHYPAVAIGGEYYFTKHLAVSAEAENLFIMRRAANPDNFVRYGIGLKVSISTIGGGGN